jgi:hypothetical protein
MPTNNIVLTINHSTDHEKCLPELTEPNYSGLLYI